MSLKAIEMQVAIPRTQNVGKIQDQLQQRGQVSQANIASEQNKTDEKKRKQVLETTESEKKRLNNDDERREHSQSQTNKEEKQGMEDSPLEETYAIHPYKGNHIDFSG